MRNYLEFEREIKTLEEQLENLKDPFHKDGLTEVDTKKINQIQNELDQKLQEVYSNLSRWQKTLVARHEDRPKAKFLINNLFSEFVNLSGDRNYGEDKSVLAGFGLFENQSVLVIGQEKGEDLDSRIKSNFGMMKPEGYRKCIRLMKIADKFNIPIISFIDTPGAHPGVGSEERGQAESIAKSIDCSMNLKVPNISIIIGEGGSGGAIALASSNKTIMLENAIYSVISPEGCASILWRDPKKTFEAADAMKLSAQDLLKFGIIDEVIEEPTGGAHRNKYGLVEELKIVIKKNLDELLKLNKEEIVNHRKQKFLSIGKKQRFKISKENLVNMTVGKNFFLIMKNGFIKFKLFIYALIVVLFVLVYFELY